MAQKIRVLVVDDSVVFRTCIRTALERSPQIEISGTANNGKIALQKLSQLSVDLVTLDMEMPEMDGLETIREIRKNKFPVRILVFSAQTPRGSEAAIQALELGADDIVAKPQLPEGSHLTSDEVIGKDLIPKVLQFFEEPGMPSPIESVPPSVPDRKRAFQKKSLSTFMPRAIVIGSSTGGPQALERVLLNLSRPPRCPILIVQHMPPVFTASLAKRIAEISGVPCAEAKDMEPVTPGRIYVAPGDFHMGVLRSGEDIRIVLDQAPLRNSVRPAADILFESAAKVFGAGCLAIVLTGMGWDGLMGCRAIKESGGGVAIQTKDTCVVFGMPGAVFEDQLQDEVGSPEELNLLIQRASTQ